MSNSIENINLLYWYNGQKRLLHKPIHFLKAGSPIKSIKQEIWIVENCKGRYHIQSSKENDFFLTEENFVYFEDMSDLVHYDLVWS